MRLSWKKGQTLRLFIDEFRSPIHARYTALATWELLAQKKTGIYHVAGCERLSRWEIGQILARRSPELMPQMEAGSLVTYQGDPRAPDTSLKCKKAQDCLSFALPGLREWSLSHPHEVF
jgi:dTDP-4-dehydrorhamnose reductase